MSMDTSSRRLRALELANALVIAKAPEPADANNVVVMAEKYYNFLSQG